MEFQNEGRELMAYRNILSNEYDRLVRAIVVDNPLLIAKTLPVFSLNVDTRVRSIMAKFSGNAKGYKIEDDGVLVGYYVVDFDAGGIPFMADYMLRKAYSSPEKISIISEQIQVWVQKEFPIALSHLVLFP